MNRSDARALAKSTLEGLSLFKKVFLSEPESFGGYDPCAVIHSKSLALLQDARDDYAAPCEIWVTIYVRRERTASEAEKDTIEGKLDDLTRASMRSLWNAFYDDAADLQIGPSETGYPNRTFDSSTYRMERFPVRFDDDTED